VITQCNKKWKSANGTAVSWLYLYMEANPATRIVVSFPVIPNSTEENRWGVENVVYCTGSTARILR